MRKKVKSMFGIMGVLAVSIGMLTSCQTARESEVLTPLNNPVTLSEKQTILVNHTEMMNKATAYQEVTWQAGKVYVIDDSMERYFEESGVPFECTTNYDFAKDDQTYEEWSQEEQSAFDHMVTCVYLKVDYTFRPNFDFYYLDLGVSEQVPDYQAPTIEEIRLSVNVDNQPSLDEILSHVIAIDETDGVVPVLVESSTYTQGQMTVGDYEIHIYAVDQAGNRANKTIYVHRYDDTKPVISGQDSYVLNYDHSVTKDSILASLSVADNVDSGLTITCVADTFSGHEHTIGTYQLEFQTTDLSGIQSDVFTVNITVENQGTPTITAPGTIEIGTSQLLSLEELKEKISVNDGYDGVITDYQISGYDNYLQHYQEVGTYSITISYTNSGGNQATTTISIVTSDQLAPGIYFDDYFILLKVGESFPESTLKAQVARVLKVAESEILEISGTYDTDVVGTYPLSVKTTSGDYDFSVKVSSMSDEEESDKNYFVELWEQTVRSFKNPFDFGGYTWLSWTFVVVGVLLILLVIKGVLKARRR